MTISFSVVTPSLDQAEYLPACIASVGEQSHSAIEHLVFDPGSTDGSREIAAAAPSVQLIAEPDEGQSDAILRGFALATGDVLAWLNSDDRYVDAKVLERVAARFEQPDQPDVVYGRGWYESSDGDRLDDAFIFTDVDHLAKSLLTGVGILQPAVFLHRRIIEKVGGPRKDLHYAMDYELWLRLSRAGARFAFLDEPLAIAVLHDKAKTQKMRGESLREAIAAVRADCGFVAWSWARSQADWEVTGQARIVPEQHTPEQLRRIDTRAQTIFDGYNRNPPTILRLLRPPWSRPQLSTLKHLVRRV